MTPERFDATPRLCDMAAYRDLVLVSGQVPSTLNADIRVQAAEALRKLDTMLVRAGSDRSRLLTTTVYLTEMQYYGGFNEVWDAWVDPANPPARDCFVVGLANPGWKVEIVATAYR